ncbi:MAG TPA: hypothetical protein VEY50_01355 [Lysobacter sp.]|nr:hypothetical protein [Lysobacter sp.]
MPDADSRLHRLPPASWGEAFAALPLEAPPAEAWPRLASALERRRRPARRWIGGAALAASVVAALALSLPRLQDQNPVDRATAVATTAPTAAPAVRTDPPTSTASLARVAAATHAPAVVPDAAPGTPAQAARASRRGAANATQPAPDTALVATQTPAAASVTEDDALYRLQDESNQLEALVALARDDRVTSGPAAVMASQLDGRIALIDVALTDAQLGEAERVQLWQQRVAALRELAGLESTQRWLAANGESYDGALVSLD